MILSELVQESKDCSESEKAEMKAMDEFAKSRGGKADWMIVLYGEFDLDLPEDGANKGEDSENEDEEDDEEDEDKDM